MAGVAKQRERFTGKVTRAGASFEARGPAIEGRAEYIGRFPSRFAAGREVDAWLRRRQEMVDAVAMLASLGLR